MPQTCTMYGLGLLLSTKVSWISNLPAAHKVDITFTLGRMPDDLIESAEDKALALATSSAAEGVLKAFRVLHPDGFRLHYRDGTRVFVSARGEQVWATWPNSLNVDEVATYLLGPVLGLVLRLREITCIHASAVVIDGAAVAFVGASGAGKSSTAAAFAARGYPVMSDDIVALIDRRHHFEVAPAYPRLRLWSDAVASLFGSEDALPRIVPTWDKRYLDLKGPSYTFATEPVKLKAIYLLGDRSVDGPLVRPLGPRDALVGLLQESYASRFLTPHERGRELDVLARLALSVRLGRITPARDIAHLDGLCREIVADLQADNSETKGVAETPPCRSAQGRSV